MWINLKKPYWIKNKVNRLTLKIKLITINTLAKKIDDSIREMNRFEKELEYYNSAIEKNPEASHYYYYKGIIMFTN